MYWGIDLGGTKIEAVVLESLQSTAVHLRKRIDTEAQQGYEHVVQRVRELVQDLSQELGSPPSIIGIGHPGSEDPTSGALKNSNTVCLNGKPLRADLHAALGCSVVMANDANCFALAESRLGAARNAHTVFGVIMGTGVGGGIVVDGKVLHGAQGIAGEWGHNILIEGGPACYCGRHGCVERFLSGPALESFYAFETGKQLSLRDIAARHYLGEDRCATATIQQLIRWFGRAIAVVINILDPDCIVLGGGVSNISELYSAGREEAAKYIFNNRFVTPIVRHELGDSAGVFGAAFLAEQHP